MGKPEIYKRDGGVCFYCGVHLTEEEASLEHLLSTTHGGNNDKNNLTIACKPCNLEAGAKSIVKKVKFRDEQMGRELIKIAPKKTTTLTIGDIRVLIEEKP
jgi:5-methylcytosine-specific restriction endonuclease McrA